MKTTERRANLIAVGVMLLVALSAAVAFLVLHEMASASAAVTGGCGGG